MASTDTIPQPLPGANPYGKYDKMFGPPHPMAPDLDGMVGRLEQLDEAGRARLLEALGCSLLMLEDISRHAGSAALFATANFSEPDISSIWNDIFDSSPWESYRPDSADAATTAP